ncbi:hypothetical protein JL720_15179 [Aureococcus anophagefferens]|nr:hypothetical protein JL720_15179 [Aureococcus anophagefferens]
MEKSARRRSSTGSRKVRRRSVLGESTNRHNNAADDAEADSDGDLCHKTDPERGETWFARWGELADALLAIDDDVAPDAFRGAARELLRRGVEIVDAADAEDAAGRDALVLRFVDGPEGRVSLPPPFDDPYSFANDYLPLYGPLRGRYGEGWRNAGGRGDFAAASPAWRWRGDDDGDVVFDYADAAASSSTSASTARHPVLAAISAKACDVAVLVMCPRCSRARGVVVPRARGIISLVVIDECDEEVGNDDSFRRSQEAQGRTIQACFGWRRGGAVVALSGTLSKFEVGSLLEALGLPPAPATLVIRTASPINSMVDIHTGDGGGVVDYVRDADDGAALVFAFRKSVVETLGDHLATQFPERDVVKIRGNLAMDEKRSRLRRLKAPLSETGYGAVGVVNEAGHRGLDHPDLRTIIVMEPPSGVKSWLQLVGRAARGAGQSGTVVVAFPRAALFAVAGIIVDDAKKLAEFTDLVRLFESVRFCWRSVAAHALDAARRCSGAVPACCPACSAALEAREAGVPAVEAIDAPEIRALLREARRGPGGGSSRRRRPSCPEPDLLSDDPHALRAEIEHLQKKLAAEKTKGLASTHTETFDKGVRECDILFGKELESLLSGALGDERLLENAFKMLRKFKGTKLALLAAGAPSTLLEKATGSYEFWAAKAGRIGRKDMKAKIGTLHVMWLGATASAAKCPNFLLWWGLVQAAKGATNVELEEMAMLRIVADRKIVRAFESEYASICSENTALWARGLAADGASTCSRDAALVDNACVTARAKFGGSDRSSASMTHFTVRVLLRIQLAAAGGLYDDAMPKFVCVQRDAYGLYGHTFASLVTGARSCSAVEISLPKVLGPPRVEEPATAAAGAELRAKDYGRVFMPFERDGQRVEIEFRPVETLSKLMRDVPDLAFPSRLVALDFPLTVGDLDPDALLAASGAARGRRASTHDAARALFVYGLADCLATLENMDMLPVIRGSRLLPKGVKLEAIATLDKLMRHSIDKVTPGHKEATEIKVLPASQHNELTTDGAARIFMDLLPIQTPASFGISDGVDRGKKQIDTLKDRAAARRGIAAANKAKEAKKRKSPVPAAALTPVPVPVLVHGRGRRRRVAAARADALDDGDAFDDGDPGDAFDRRDRRDPGGDGDDGDPATTATAATAATPSSSTPDGPADEAVFLRLLRDEGLSDCALISPATSKGLVMTCSDGLTVSRYESALAKLRDAVIDGAGSKEEANIVLKQLSLFLTCNVVEHDRLHAVFHLTHLTLKHGFEHLGRAVARARGLTGVTTSSAEAGQNVRKKVHHERIQCLAAVKELVSAMLRDDAFRSRVDALPVEGGTIKQADFVALLVAFLTSGDGGSEFECVRDHALLAMNLHAFKTSLQWRHWLFANVAETISTPAMLANNKPNYGILFLELPFLSRMRSLAQSLGFWRRR